MPTREKSTSLNGHSKPETAPLSSIQRWFQTFIVAPGDSQDAVEAAQAASGLKRVDPATFIKPSKLLTPLQRMMIYRDQYLLRMDEALSIDYPVLQQYLGEDRFFQLVEQYVEAHPSTSYTLNDLGRYLSAYILKAPGFKQRTLLHDLCRVEWALTCVLDEDEVPSLTQSEIDAIAPEQWANSILTLLPSIRVLELKYPILRLLEAYREGLDFPEVKPKPNWLMTWRKGGATWRMPLDRPTYEFMLRLLSGSPVGQAMDEVLTRRRVRPEQLFQAFGSWLAEGFVTRVAPAP